MSEPRILNSARQLDPDGNLVVKLASGRSIRLTPVSMADGFPSHDPARWNRFQRAHVPGAALAPDQLELVQRFMRRAGTEALHCELGHVTIAGNGFAHCIPGPKPKAATAVDAAP